MHPLTSADEQSKSLSRRARRLAKKGKYRKAAIALRERAALIDTAESWISLGSMLVRAQRLPEAVRALRMGMWLHRRSGGHRRAITVARLISQIDH